MDKVVSALLWVIEASFIVSFILYVMMIVRLKECGLDEPNDENWSWIRGLSERPAPLAILVAVLRRDASCLSRDGCRDHVGLRSVPE
jgi:hypothetical protein